MKTYVVIGNGTNKNGESYSKIVPLVKTREGNEYLDLKNPAYLDKIHPLFKKFTNEIKEA